MDKALIALLSAVIAGIVWVARSLWIARPRVVVSYSQHGGGSTVGNGPDFLSVHWRYRLVLKNVAKYDALELSAVATNNSQLLALPVSHVKGLEQVDIDRRLEKQLDTLGVVAARHQFHGALEPVELSTLNVVLRYKSENRFTFYTHYVRKEGVESNRFYLRLPKTTDA